MHRLSRSLGEFRTAWDALNLRYLGGHPYMDSRFIEPLLACFATGKEHLCVHRTGDEIDGMVILVKVRPGIWRKFSPAQRQVSPALLPDAALLDTLFARLPGAALVIELTKTDPDFPLRPIGRPDSRIIDGAHTMSVSVDGSFESYWAGRPRKLVQNLRRYRRRAEEDKGRSGIRVLSGFDSMADAVERFGQLESSGWKGAQGTAVHASNVQGRFYTEVMRGFAVTGQAEVLEYWLGDQLAASRLVIRNDSMTVMLKTAYNEALAHYAPGRLLLMEALRREFGGPQPRRVEFYTDATADLLAWATASRHLHHVMLFRSGWVARGYDFVHRVRTALRRPGQGAQADPAGRHGDAPRPALASAFDTASAMPADHLPSRPASA